ncbi:MAG: lamin tail domain-containing protein [Aquaticitalea sp.]
MIQKYSLVVLTWFCFILSGFGQVTIYNETMYNGTGGASGNAIATHETNDRFNEDVLTYSGSGDMRTTLPSDYIGASGTWNAMINANTETFIMDGLNASTYSSVTLSFGLKKSASAETGSSLIVEYSTTGPAGPFTGLSWGSLPIGSGTSIWYLFSGIAVPNTITTLRFRDTTSEQFRIDDIVIRGNACTDFVEWANVQFPTASPQNILHGGNFDVYARTYEPGVTPVAGADPSISAWIGYNTTDNNPNLPEWTWIPATNYTGQFGNDDEYMAEIGSGLAPGTYYYASRFNLNSCGFVYGGTGGIWNNDSVELIVTADQVNFCNVEFPKTGIIPAGNPFTVYTQGHEPGVTDAVGQGAGLNAWIGYNTTGVDYEPWNPTGWTWVPAAYNPTCFDCNGIQNDEYSAEIGSTLPVGTYYYASRWQLNGSIYSYGGIDEDNMGNFWDPVTYNSGILTVTNTPCSDLIISEYVEGSGNNKYLEIFNGTGVSVNLANYKIRTYSNGSNGFASADLSGTLANGATRVYRNTNATIYGGASTVLSTITFNGNDAVALVNNTTIIDVIGQIGFNPGTAWTGGSASTLDQTLIRKSTVQVGDANGTDVFSPNVEWLSFPINSVSELGYHFSSCHPDRELQLELPIGTIVYCGHTYEFGNQIVNTNTDVVLRLRNLGDLPLQINSLAFATGIEYSLVAPPATPFSIPAASFQDITIRFNPTALGLFLDTLTVNSNDASESSCTIDFSGLSVSNCDTTTAIIAAQDFESSVTDTWAYTAVHAPLAPYWDVTNSLSNIATAQNGTSFWGITDLERAGHTNETHELSFNFNISTYTNVKLSFNYYTTELETSDTFEYQLLYDGIPQGIVDISADTDAWTEVLINIPNSISLLEIIFYADIDAANDNAGLDNFILSSTILDTATWDSGHWNWNEGTALDTAPSSSTTVILNDDYDTATYGSFEACQLYINPTYTLDINNSTYVEVENFATINGDIRVQTHGSFVQRADFNNGFVLNPGGSASVLKSTSIINNWYDYTYWSSPVFGTTVAAAIDIAPASRRFFYEAANYLDVFAETGNNNAMIPGNDDIDDNGDDWQLAPGSMIMAPGQGFAATVFNSGMFPGTRQVTFNGSYNTGTLTTPVFWNGANGDNDWNLIGNPYPSAISFNDLYDANSSFIDGAAYLWSHSTIPPSDTNNGNEAQNFSDDYAIINRFSGNVAGGSGVTPASGNFIPSGQSFFVKGLSNGAVTFNNDMRMADTSSNNQFFRTGNLSDKFWINLTSNNGVFNQILVAYVDGATDGDDGMAYDATRNLSSGVASILYTIIDGANDRKYAIQGKDSNSLNLDEIIPLGFYTSITEPTSYKLSIAEIQGVFLTSNTVYLKDNLLNVTFNLSSGDYVFSSEVGEFNSRFEIVFKDQALSVFENEISPSGLTIVELADGRVKFSVGNDLNIKSVEIIDMIGRSLYQLKGQNSTEIYELSNLSQAAYMAKVGLSNGQVITKKAVKRK